MFIELFWSGSHLQTNRNSWLQIENLTYEGGPQNIKELLFGGGTLEAEKKTQVRISCRKLLSD